MKASQAIRTIQGVFERDPQTGSYTATAPGLPGCITEGGSLEDARKALIEAAQGYLEALAIEGEPLPDLLGSEVVISSIPLRPQA